MRWPTEVQPRCFSFVLICMYSATVKASRPKTAASITDARQCFFSAFAPGRHSTGASCGSASSAIACSNVVVRTLRNGSNGGRPPNSAIQLCACATSVVDVGRANPCS
eukprot:4912285-Prymnesium_polylepis.1